MVADEPSSLRSGTGTRTMSALDHSLQMLFSILESTDRIVSLAKTTRALLLSSSTSPESLFRLGIYGSATVFDGSG